MATLVIKDLPEKLHRRLKEEAKKAHRSMTGEAIHLLEAGLDEGKIPAAQGTRASYRTKSPLTDKLIDQWKRDGMTAETAAVYLADDSEILKAWIHEAEKRYDDYLSEKTKAVPAFEALKKIRTKHKK